MARLRFLARLGFALASVLVMGALSVDLLQTHSRALPLLALSNRVEKGAPLGVSLLKEPPAEILSALQQPSCLSSASRARLTVSLAFLDEAMRQADFVQVDIWRQHSLEAAMARLRCVPTDGNAWLQYALAALPQTGASPAVLAAFDRSYRYAPYEEWVMAVRMPVAMDLAWRARLPYADKARQDFGAFIHLGRNIEVALQNVFRYPEELRPVLAAIIPKVTAERQQHLRHVLEEGGLDLGLFGAKQEIRNPFSGDVLFRTPVPAR